MALDAIESVRAAEQKAEETTRAAAQQAAQIVAKAEDEAAVLLTEAEDKAKSAAAGTLAAAHEDSRKFLEAEGNSLNAEMQALCSAARARQGDAVRTVLEHLA